ncbi:MAG: hypothetical protein CXR30_04930 [Geobacter sp.]|nr:MAG: hypothetical protein CXR30_04930 [Geobacter sp.]
MLVDRGSLGYKLIAPSLIIIAVVFVFLLILISRITHSVQEDYSRFTVSEKSSDAAQLLSAAASEITMANLAGNPVVVEAKQKNVRDSLSALWAQNGYDGIIAVFNGPVIYTSLPPAQTKAMVADGTKGYFTINVNGTSYACNEEAFPLWKWKVITAKRHTHSQFMRSQVVLLAPLVTVGCLFMAVGIFLVIRKNLQEPISMMVSAVSREEAVAETGVRELDFIGNAVNSTLVRLRERTTKLESELIERSRAEDALRGKDAHIRRLLNFTEEGIYGLDLDGYCTFCNLSCLNMLGYDSEEALLGGNIHDLIHHSYPDGTPYPSDECKIYTAFIKREPVNIQNEVYWRQDGTSFPVEYWAHPILENGEITGAVVTFMDISQRRQLEDQLLQSQKMEAIGHMAGGIAHDFNNLLMAITGYGEMLRRTLGPDENLRRYVDNILASGERGAELTRGLLAFSRKQVLNPRPADLNDLVGGMEKILRRLMTENIEMKTILAGRDLTIMADRGQIDQVLMNIVTNARDSMRDGGQLTISTGLFHADEYYALHHSAVSAGDYACLSVSDSGLGMSETVKEKMFEPFFTTKGVGKGTGLGLSIVYGIVKQHNGFINVYSELGRGTTIKIFFPLCNDKETLPEVRPEIRGGTETILIAEDDETVRTVCKMLVESQGYTVIEAVNGEEAIEAFSRSQGNIDLLLFDVIMPGKNGREAWEEINTVKPGVKILFMSGYTDEIISRQGILESGFELIEKPIASEHLLRKLREVLDR